MRIAFALAISTVITLLLSAGCTSLVREIPPAISTPAPPAPSTAGITLAPGQPDILIKAAPGRYSPLMPSTIGLRVFQLGYCTRPGGL
ncbi:MAG: hypothetical protein NQU46_03075 [Methanolinea sp.]|nr:hypothetical protein [Methanolinea sp.]